MVDKMLNEKDRKDIARTIWYAEHIPPKQAKKYVKKLFPNADLSKLDFSIKQKDKKFTY